MIFQIIDDKKKCISIFSNGKLFVDKEEVQKELKNINLSCTWQYSHLLFGREIEYANLYVGKDLDYACPDELKDDWINIKNRFKSFIVSLKEAQISVNSECLLDVVPHKVVREFLEIKNKICEHVIENYKKPAHYEQLLRCSKMVAEIKQKKLKLNFENLEYSNFLQYERDSIDRIKKLEPFINYDIFGSVTGRLTTKHNSFPFLNLKKKYRNIVVPSNDELLELDYNANECRVALSLNEREQPLEDIHEWNVKNVFNSSVDREQSKKEFFAWLFNPNSQNAQLEQIYNREKIKNKYYKDGLVKTIYGREIECDDYHALNYVVQSTASDMTIEQAEKVQIILRENKNKSFIKAITADSILIDLASEDREEISRWCNEFSFTRFGEFRVNVLRGSSFGEMKKII